MNTDNSTQSLTTSSESKELTKQPLTIDENGKKNLITTAKWSNFIAIVGIVMSVFFVLVGISVILVSPTAGEYQDFQALPAFSFTFIGIIYIISAILYFIPCYFLFLFSKKTRLGVNFESQERLDEGLTYLKRLAKYVGIITIIILALILFTIPLVFLSAGIMQILTGGIIA